MKIVPLLTAAVLLAAVLLPAAGHAQSPASATAATESPQFDAATIKHRYPNDSNPYSTRAGFYGDPGGRVFIGSDATYLIQLAYSLQSYQINGGPDWVNSEWFLLNAVPPDNSPSRNQTIRTPEPTAEQRQMLRSLLRDRFGLQYHFETKEGEVYLLTRGSKPLQFVPPEKPDGASYAVVFMRQGGIVDGEAQGTNTTVDYLATRLSYYLRLPVLNQTGVTGSWDFHLKPVDPDNHDLETGVYSVVDRLGLKIKRGRGPIQTLIIDHIDHPSMD